MRLREIFSWDKIIDDMRNWAVGIIMTAVLAIIVAFVVGLWQALRKQPIPWVILGALVLIAIALLIVAIASVRSQRRHKVIAAKSPENIFQVRCGTDFTSTNIWPGNVPVRFLHARISIESGTVHGCRAYLTEIKGGRTPWNGNEQLTFSPSESSDSLSKAIYAGVPYDLDVLVVTSAGEIVVCNHNRQWPRWPRLRDLFASHGEYTLTLVIAGEDARAESFALRFEWTGNWQTARLTLQDSELREHANPENIIGKTEAELKHEAWEKDQAERGIMVNLPRAEKIEKSQVDTNAVERKIRSSICSKLNELSRGGNDLLKRMMMSGGYPSVEGQFNQWSQRCEEYLGDSLGATALKLFHSPASGMLFNPMKMSSTMIGESWDYQSHLYDRIFSRVTRLDEISRMVESGEIEPC